MAAPAGPTATENFSWSWRWLREAEEEGRASNVLVRGQDGLSVLFHPNYSSGTAAVRGDCGLVRPFHYYWEVRMMRPVYGTDVIVGLATKDLDLSQHTNNFASLIGSDKHSWGFSFHGYVQHDGQKRKYGRGWGKDDVVGVHFDSWRGNIQFYVNRKPLGVAYHGLPPVEMFPVVSSTAAKSEVKLITALSFPNTLQFECFKTLSEKLPKSDLLNVYIPPGLRKFVRNNYWFLVMNRKSPCQELDVSSKKKVPRRVVKSKKPEKCFYLHETTLQEDSDDERECFLNIRKKKLDLMRKNSPQEENSSLHHISSSSSSRVSESSTSSSSYRESDSSEQPVSSLVNHSDRNLPDESDSTTKKPRLRLRLRR